MYALRFTFCLSVCLFLSEFAASDESREESERHAVRCRSEELEPWSYRGNNGPEHWGEVSPQCHGRSQSPIHIDTRRVVQGALGRIIFYYFTPLLHADVINDGHTLVVNVTDNYWRGIYVNSTFCRLQQIHFHWGSDSTVGSEHVVDEERYPLEMHLVHRCNNNRTTVAGIFFEEVEEINAEFQHIINQIPKVMYKNTQTRMHYRLDLLNLLPENPASFYRYEGSLTTPDCTECVTWTVVRTPNHVGRSQLTELRKLFSSPQNMTENGCRLVNNFRPVQHLHRRRVLASW